MNSNTQLVVELLRLGSFLTRIGNRLVADYGLSQQQFVILKTIEERGSVSQSQLRNELLYERSNVSKAVSHLIAGGLVETSKSPDDGRITFLSITAEGKKTVGKCMAEFGEWNAKWSTQLSATERRQAIRLLQKLK